MGIINSYKTYTVLLVNIMVYVFSPFIGSTHSVNVLIERYEIEKNFAYII